MESQVGLYARVSSELQADANTIDSQIAELQARIRADEFDPAHALLFADQGYSGATLVRPALERLRDVAAGGGLDRLYVHCPDRLARNYAHQILLVEELSRAGVEVVFLNRSLGQTPEDQLLLQMQGMIAEYERAKFLERSRRGKRYAAQQGRVSVLCHAPYGYRYLRAEEGGGTVRFEIVREEARVVRQVFTWVGQERCTLREVCHRLQQAGVLTRSGKPRWNHRTVWDMLKNPAYQGQAAFGRTRSQPLQPRLRVPRGRPQHSRRGYSLRETPPDQWISIPVPPLVDEALFEAVQEQLRENQRRGRIPEKGSRYLLQGLIVCAPCGYAYGGLTNSPAWAYYRCSGSNAHRWGGTRICQNAEVRMDVLDQAVWQEGCRLLEEPERLEQEYRRRLQPSQTVQEQSQVQAQVGRLQRGISRLTDSYAEGVMEKQEFEPRVTRLRERLRDLEQEQQRLQEEADTEEELRWIIGRLKTFAAQVKNGLQEADWPTRRELIRTLVKRVEMDQDQVRVVFRVAPGTSPDPPHTLQHYWERVLARTLHDHMADLPLGQPVHHHPQLRGSCAKGLHFVHDLLLRPHPHAAGSHPLLMHIQASAT